MKGLKTLSLLFLIVVLVGCAKQVSQTQQVQQAPSAPSAPSPSAPSVSTTTASAAPELDTKCDVVVGIVPGSIKQDTQDSVSATIKNNGRKTVEGAYFLFAANDKMSYRKNDETIEPGKTITYTVDVAQAATDLGVVAPSFVILPIENGKACENQRLVIIK